MKNTSEAENHWHQWNISVLLIAYGLQMLFCQQRVHNEKVNQRRSSVCKVPWLFGVSVWVVRLRIPYRAASMVSTLGRFQRRCIVIWSEVTFNDSVLYINNASYLFDEMQYISRDISNVTLDNDVHPKTSEFSFSDEPWAVTNEWKVVRCLEDCGKPRQPIRKLWTSWNRFV